jgi:hypothetical protein
MIRRGPSPADDFAQIANAALRDERLSWKARGLLAYLMTHKEGWRTSVARLTQKAPDGREAVRSGIAELVALGYLTRSRSRERDERGRLGDYDYTVTDRPTSGFPTLGEPTSGNPTAKKTTEKNTNGREDDQPRPRGRATDEQVAYLSDLHVQAGGVMTPEIEATFAGYSISKADAEIREAKRYLGLGRRRA